MQSSEIDDFYIDDLSNHHTKLNPIVQATQNVSITLGIMTLATFLSFLFRYIGLHESNIIVAFILGVLLVAKQTEGYFYGIIASVIGVLAFNYFFTQPYYSFTTYRPDYPVTFIIMLVAAIITSTLTTKVKQEARLSYLREKRAQILYQISKRLLKVRSINEIAEVGAKDIAKLFNRSVMITTANPSEGLGQPYIYANFDEQAKFFELKNELQIITETFKTGKPMGRGTESFAESRAYYLPIKGQSGILGVVGVSCPERFLSGEQKNILGAVITQIALAMERERLSEKQRKAKMEVESERLRGNLLRAMSHDLRTPLTAILGATTTILDHGDVLEQEVQKKLLQDVYEDANWLFHSVENILSITRMDEGKIEIKKNMEAVEEVVGEALSRIKKLSQMHTIKVNLPDDLIMLPMDGTLIEQVLVNLIDNAIKYTPYHSIIEIKTYIAGEKVVFEVSDNGSGIAKENLPLIFNRFYTTSSINGSGRRGTGLGLAICKSIIRAHGGEISAFNNSSGGATFRFELPAKE
jgi:two-component system, OmpR family, sensor histidine kinase KdpD